MRLTDDYSNRRRHAITGAGTLSPAPSILSGAPAPYSGSLEPWWPALSSASASFLLDTPSLERLRLAARARGDSQPTADTLVSWAQAFILFHNKRHPSELGLPEVTHFLEQVVKTAGNKKGSFMVIHLFSIAGRSQRE